LGKRLIGRSESADMIHWSEPETILVPDDLDPPDIEFYGMPVLVYEGIYVALPWIFSTTNTTHHPELAVSRDGVHYQREFRSPFISRGSRTDFDGTSIYAHAPIVHGDRILTFYNGASWRSPDQLMAQGNGAHAAIGLAVTRLDGFVSLDGVKGLPDGEPPKRKAPAYSEMVTRSFSFAGSRLHLNVQSVLQQWGWSSRDASSDNILGCEARVEILEPNHAYIPGYEFDDADPVNVPDGLDQIVSWNGQSDISRFSGKTIKLRFHFKNCKLYSYWFR
jgi:hypothetical protein